MAHDTTAATTTGVPAPGVAELFAGLFMVSLFAFGGAAPWARRMLVETRRWLTPDEFAEALAVCQVLPGPNVLNLAIMVGHRFQGVAGAVAGIAGLVGFPFALVLVFGSLYARYRTLPAVEGVLHGLASAAAGIVIAMVAHLLGPLVRRRALVPLLFVLAGFVAVGVLRVSLPLAMLVLGPLSIAAAWRAR
jgi:chromate transporter